MSQHPLPKIPRFHIQCVDVQVRDVDVPDLFNWDSTARVGTAGMAGFVAAASGEGTRFWRH
jgi:hypothetical protein